MPMLSFRVPGAVDQSPKRRKRRLPKRLLAISANPDFNRTEESPPKLQAA